MDFNVSKIFTGKINNFTAELKSFTNKIRIYQNFFIEKSMSKFLINQSRKFFEINSPEIKGI